MMGGGISVTSEPGNGSTFTVWFPATVSPHPEPPRPQTEPATATTAKSSDASGPTVLVIDDDPAVREVMTRSFAAERARGLTAADGEEGLRLARARRPDLIFLDVLMPRMDGWAVLTELKKDPATADIPVVMMTLHSNQEMGYLLGASEYLTKPVDRERLAAVLRRYQPTKAADVVLIVEDDAPTRDVLHRSLEKQGWQVAEAENGRVGLSRVAEHTPGLVLLDLMMPEMDGFEFLSELRQNPSWQSIPVVVLTSKDLTPDERTALSGQVERILQKGAYSREALLAEVRKIVSECARKPGGCDVKEVADAVEHASELGGGSG
jgi:CheY-like chemotaxis protein